MKFIVYLDAAGEWRWHLRAANGRFVACSGEGFTRMADCIESINVIRHGCVDTCDVDVPGGADAD